MEPKDMTALEAIVKELQGINKGIQDLLPILRQAIGEPSLKTETEEEPSALGDDVMSESDDHDDLYEEARKAIMQAGKASTSYLQRKLGIGYARAARLMDMLEEKGVIGPAIGATPRRIIRKLTPDVIAILAKIEKQLMTKPKKAKKKPKKRSGK